MYSLKQFSSGLVAIFLLLQLLITAILAWGFFAKSLTLFNGLAFVFILSRINSPQSSNLIVKASKELLAPLQIGSANKSCQGSMILSIVYYL